MAIIAVDPRVEEVFVIASERALPENEQTKFHIAPLTVSEEAVIRDELYRGSVIDAGGGQRVRGATVNLQATKAFEMAVRDVTGLIDGKGAPVKYDRSNIQESISRIPPNILWEVGRYIVERMDLSPVAVKN